MKQMDEEGEFGKFVLSVQLDNDKALAVLYPLLTMPILI